MLQQTGRLSHKSCKLGTRHIPFLLGNNVPEKSTGRQTETYTFPICITYTLVYTLTDPQAPNLIDSPFSVSRGKMSYYLSFQHVKRFKFLKLWPLTNISLDSTSFCIYCIWRVVLTLPSTELNSDQILASSEKHKFPQFVIRFYIEKPKWNTGFVYDMEWGWFTKGK